MVGYKSNKLSAFFEQFPKRNYAKGQILFMPGDRIDYAYYLESGNVKVYTFTYKGDQVILQNISKHTFFPSSPIITDVPLLYYYQASSDIAVRIAPKDDVLTFIKGDAELLFSLLGQTHLTLVQNTRKLHHLMAGNAKDLVVYELLNELHVNGEIDEKGNYTIGISEQDLGARAGLTRETVSREIKRLKDQGLVETHRRKIIIKGVMELETRLQHFI